MSKSLGMTTSCGTSDFSTRATWAAGGPRCSACSSSTSAASGPSASTSTDPSLKLRASPRRPRRLACRQTNHRKPTPWTRPSTRKRVAVTPLLLAVLRGATAVPPDVHRRDQSQDRQHEQDGATRVALRLLIQNLQDHILATPDEPADPGQDGAPHQRAEPGEQHEPPEMHFRD